VTLVLHGDLVPESVSPLRSVVDALVLFQPDSVVVDLSEVGRVSSSALRMIDRRGVGIGVLVLRDPSPSACSHIETPGRSQFIEPESTQSVQADGVGSHLEYATSSVAGARTDEHLAAMAEVPDDQMPDAGAHTNKGETWLG
jgi:anti-anti-sigma regulatory factor